MEYLLFGFGVFAFSALTAVLVTRWDMINARIYESSLVKYEITFGEFGPTTYLIFHDDFDVLQSMANTHEDILGIEQHEGSNVATMAFASAKSPKN